MAICKYCNREMLEHITCHPKIIIGGKEYKRISARFQDSARNYCGDCSCDITDYHHFGCDMERCPVCNGQMLGHIISGMNCPVGGDITHLVDSNGNKIPVHKNPETPKTLDEAKKKVEDLSRKIAEINYKYHDESRGK